MLVEVRKRLADPHASLDSVCGILSATAAQPAQAKRRRESTGRHVRWQRADDYVCVERGARDFCTAAELDAAWVARSLTLGDMYLMRHREADALGKRSQLNPIWEALYRVGDQWVRVQKCHLRHAYEQAGRRDKALAWTLTEAGMPYWVDRHAFSVLKIK